MAAVVSGPAAASTGLPAEFAKRINAFLKDAPKEGKSFRRNSDRGWSMEVPVIGVE